MINPNGLDLDSLNISDASLLNLKDIVEQFTKDENNNERDVFLAMDSEGSKNSPIIIVRDDNTFDEIAVIECDNERDGWLIYQSEYEDETKDQVSEESDNPLEEPITEDPDIFFQGITNDMLKYETERFEKETEAEEAQIIQKAADEEKKQALWICKFKLREDAIKDLESKYGPVKITQVDPEVYSVEELSKKIKEFDIVCSQSNVYKDVESKQQILNITQGEIPFLIAYNKKYEIDGKVAYKFDNWREVDQKQLDKVSYKKEERSDAAHQKDSDKTQEQAPANPVDESVAKVKDVETITVGEAGSLTPEEVALKANKIIEEIKQLSEENKFPEDEKERLLNECETVLQKIQKAKEESVEIEDEEDVDIKTAYQKANAKIAKDGMDCLGGIREDFSSLTKSEVKDVMAEKLAICRKDLRLMKFAKKHILADKSKMAVLDAKLQTLELRKEKRKRKGKALSPRDSKKYYRLLAKWDTLADSVNSSIRNYNEYKKDALEKIDSLHELRKDCGLRKSKTLLNEERKINRVGTFNQER